MYSLSHNLLSGCKGHRHIVILRLRLLFLWLDDEGIGADEACSGDQPFINGILNDDTWRWARQGRLWDKIILNFNHCMLCDCLPKYVPHNTLIRNEFFEIYSKEVALFED